MRLGWIVAGWLLLASAGHAQELDRDSKSGLARLEYNLKSLRTQLDRKNKRLTELYLKRAIQEWGRLQKGLKADQKGHPDVLKAGSQLKKAQEEAKALGVEIRPELSPKAQRLVRDLNYELGKAERSFQRKAAKDAKSSFTKAREMWGSLPNELSPDTESHPDVVKVKERYESLLKKLEAAGVLGPKLPDEAKKALATVKRLLDEAADALKGKKTDQAADRLKAAREAFAPLAKHGEHPDVADARKRLESIDAEILRARSPKLPYEVRSRLDKMNSTLTGLDKYVEEKDQGRVSSYLRQAAALLHSLRTTYKAQCPEDHPEVKKTFRRFHEVLARAGKAGLDVASSLPGRPGKQLYNLARSITVVAAALQPKKEHERLPPQSIRILLGELHFHVDRILTDSDGGVPGDHPAILQIRERIRRLEGEARTKGVPVDALGNRKPYSPLGPLKREGEAAVADMDRRLEILHAWLRPQAMNPQLAKAFEDTKDAMVLFRKAHSSNPRHWDHPAFRRIVYTYGILEKWYLSFRSEAGGKAKLFRDFAASVGPLAEKLKEALWTFEQRTEASSGLPDSDALRRAISNLDSILPKAVSAAAAFRKAFPGDLEAHANKYMGDDRDRFKKVQSAESALLSIEETPARAAKSMKEKTKKYAGEAERVLKWSTDRLAEMRKDARAGEIYARQASELADKAEEYALGIHAIFPIETESKRGEEEMRWVKQASAVLDGVVKVRQAVAKFRKQDADEAKLRLQRARFPAPKKTGGDWDRIAKEMEGIINREWKNRKVMRVGISTDWEVRQEWARYGNQLSWEHFKYVWANVAVDMGDGRYRVYYLSFRRMKSGDGWGDLAHWGVGSCYDILKENIFK